MAQLKSAGVAFAQQNRFNASVMASHPFQILLHDTISLLESNCKTTKGWLSSELHLTSPRLRHKRQIAALGFAVGSIFGGFVSSWLQNDNTARLQHQVQIQNHKILLLERSLTAVTKSISDIYDLFALQHFNSELTNQVAEIHRQALNSARHIDLIHSTLTALFHHQLDISILTADQLTFMFKEAKKLANTHRLLLTLTDPEQIMELPATFSTSATGLTIHIFIPLVRQQFMLYKYLNSPVFMQDDNGKSPAKLAFMKSPHSLLALDDHGTLNIPLNPIDLDDCLHLGNHYLCTDLVKLTNYASSCIGTMFSADIDKILKHCPIVFTDAPFDVTKRSNSTYLVSTIEDMPALKTCHLSEPKAYRKHILLPRGQTEVSIDPGCTLQTAEFTLSGSDLSIPSMGLLTPVPADFTLQLLQGRNLSTLEETRQNLLRHGQAATEMVLQNLLKAEALPNITLGETQAAGYVIYIFLTVLLIAYFARMLQKYIQKRRQKARDIRSALNEMLMVQHRNNQVQRLPHELRASEPPVPARTVLRSYGSEDNLLTQLAKPPQYSAQSEAAQLYPAFRRTIVTEEPRHL